MQDLKVADELIKKKIQQRSTIPAIYKEVRSQGRFNSFGDYPIIAKVVRMAQLSGSVVTSKDVVSTFKQARDKEFNNLHSDNYLVQDLCLV